MDLKSNAKRPELRKVQTAHRKASYIISLPKCLVEGLGVEKGDYVKCMLSGKQLLIEKATF